VASGKTGSEFALGAVLQISCVFIHRAIVEAESYVRNKNEKRQLAVIDPSNGRCFSGDDGWRDT
jgi:hypothetical protein